MLFAGLRRREIFALQFSDIDWDADLVKVHPNLFWHYGKYPHIPEGEPSLIITCR